MRSSPSSSVARAESWSFLKSFSIAGTHATMIPAPTSITDTISGSTRRTDTGEQADQFALSYLQLKSELATISSIRVIYAPMHQVILRSSDISLKEALA